MARVANCPQCDHELFVPDNADSEAWAKCPECRAFFQVKQAPARDVAAALLVESDEAAPPKSPESAIPDFSSADTWQNTDDNFADVPELEEISATTKSDADELKLEDDELQIESSSGDDLEAAAQRIDEWFRSNKTVPDAPPVAENDAADMDEIVISDEDIDISDEDTKRSEPRAGATVDFSADDMENMGDLGVSQDFELDDAIQPAANTDWDEPQDLDRMTSDADEFKLENEEDGTATQMFDSSVEEAPAIDTSNAADEVAGVMPSETKPKRKRSSIVSILMVTAASIIGLAAGYLVLLWLRGPSIDFLQVAELLPKAILPSSFDEKTIVPTTPPAQIAQNQPETRSDEAESQPAEPQELAADESAEAMPGADQTAATEPTADAAGATEEVPADASAQPAEVQTSFEDATETAEDAEAAEATESIVGDRYAATASPADETATDVTSEEALPQDLTAEKPVTPDLDELGTEATETPAEAAETELETAQTDELSDAEMPADPNANETPSVDPIFGETETATAEVTELAEPVQISDAPTFSAEDLSAAVDVASKAQPELVNGNFSDGKAVQQAKGKAYMQLADLAQKVTFVDEPAAATPQQKDVDKLFRKTLSDAHTRGEIAQIVSKWIASPNRKHGGVFFAASVVKHDNAGSVAECEVELDGGQKMTVLVPAAAATEAGSGQPVGIVGWILDTPKAKVDGYTGSAPQAIFAKKLITLE
jgi:hypothetical protein